MLKTPLKMHENGLQAISRPADDLSESQYVDLNP